jgi:hypothetical protein
MKTTVDTARLIAGCFALAAFAVAIVAGLGAEHGAAQVLLRSVIAMMLCYPVGLVAGMVCERVMRAHVESLRAAEAARESSDLELESQSSSSPSPGAAASSLPGQEVVADPLREPSRAAA